MVGVNMYFGEILILWVGVKVDITWQCLKCCTLLFSFVQYLQPKANIKSSSTMRKRICPRLYNNIKQAVDSILTEEIADVDGMAITADHWTSRSYDSYQSMTLHYINKDFSLRKVR